MQAEGFISYREHESSIHVIMITIPEPESENDIICLGIEEEALSLLPELRYSLRHPSAAYTENRVGYYFLNLTRKSEEFFKAAWSQLKNELVNINEPCFMDDDE